MHLRLDRWLLGLPVIAALAAGCAWRFTPEIESRLRAGAEAIQASDPSPDGAEIRIDIAGRDATLVVEPGTPDAAIRRLAGPTAAIAGLRRVGTRVLQPIAMRPFRFALRREGGRVTMTGAVPTGVLRRELAMLLRARIPAGEVVDRADLATGEPDGFADAARFLVLLLATVPAGDAALSDRTFDFSASPPDSPSYASAMALLRAPPPGFAPARVGLVPPLVANFLWVATREAGSIVLSGHVPSEDDRAALAKAVAAAVPDARVADEMQTVRGLPRDVDFGAVTRAALVAIARLDSAAAAFSGHRLELTGRAVARDILAEVGSGLRRALPAAVALGRLDLAAIPASPFVVAIRRGAGWITLSGYVPDEAGRAALVAAAGRRFPSEAIRDDLHLADGAPPDFAAAAARLAEPLSMLADGEARLADTRATLSGRVLYRELGARLRSRFADGFPAGWSAAADIVEDPREKPLAVDLCRDLVGDALRREPIRFEPGGIDPAPASRRTLEGVTSILRRCGPGEARVSAPADQGAAPEAAEQVSRQRAAALAALIGKGLEMRISAAAKAGAGQVEIEVGP